MKRTFEVKTKDLIVWEGQIVMSRTEAPFFDSLFQRVAKLRPRHVLEVGFGLGISARLIQEHLNPDSHDIVEIDASIYEDLARFASKRKHINPIQGDFQTFTPRRKYNFVFHDPFVYTADTYTTEAKEREYWKQTAKRLREFLAPGGIACRPLFGDDLPARLPGFRRKLLERFDVPSYLLEVGTMSSRGGVVCWQRS